MNLFVRYILISYIFLYSCSRNNKVNDNSIENNSKYNTETVSKKQINWMSHWYGRAGKEVLIRKIAREFEFQHQELIINLKFIQEAYNVSTDDRRQFNAEVIDMIKTGKTSWDILVLDNPSYELIANELNDRNWGAKYLINFEEFGWFRDRHKSFLFEGSQYRRNTGGIIPGPLIEGDYITFWYNDGVAKKLGLNIKKHGMTFTDLKNYFEKAYKYNQSNPEKIILLYDDNQAQTAKILLNSLVISELGQFEPENLDRTTALSALKKGLSALEELSRFKPLGRLPQGSNSNDPLLEMNALFYIKDTWIYNKWAEIDEKKAALIFPSELPSFEKAGIYYQGTYQSVYAVLKQSPNKNEAIEAMKYLCSNDVAERWSNMTKNPTGLKTRINATDFGIDDFEEFNNYISHKYGKHVQTIYLSDMLFGAKNSSVVIDPAGVLEGKLTAEEYYNQVINQLK